MVKEQKIKNACTMLALCNNVTPTGDGDKRVLQASSPDEIAFVEFTDSLGFFMQERKLNEITIKDETCNGNLVKFEILCVVPFRSETKKMRIIIRVVPKGNIVLMVKGAESELTKLLTNNESQWLIYKSKEISKRGLRTLAFCYK